MKDQVKAFKAPSPIIILVCVIVFCAIASYIIPAGVYDRVKDVQTGKMVVDPSTFHYVAQKPTGFLDFFTSINKGFKGGISIIAFLFMVGGSLNILAKTGAIVAGLSALVEKLKNRSVLLIPVLMTTLATFSTLAGCNEEYLAFTPLVVSVALALGFDSLTALGMLFCSVAAGYGAGCTQPFSVGVAQGSAGNTDVIQNRLPPISISRCFAMQSPSIRVVVSRKTVATSPSSVLRSFACSGMYPPRIPVSR